jgi:dihydropteroate synthase
MRVDRGVWTFPGELRWDLAERTRILGILNVTPDSFSDGGRFLDPEAAVARGLAMVEEGADAIDVGGESTRPGSEPVPEDVQIARVVPIIRALRQRLDARTASVVSGQSDDPHVGMGPSEADPVHISIDTSRARVAGAALEAGARIVNDVSGLRGDPDMAPLLARTGAAAILMHMRGVPATMQKEARYDDLLAEVASELRESLRLARNAGVSDDRIVLDPGIGFGKTSSHNLRILARLSSLAAIGRPLLIGVSRKSFLGTLTGLPVGDRLEASLAAGAAAVMNGASILRVHDVAASVTMVRVLDAIRRAGDEGPERAGR